MQTSSGSPYPLGANWDGKGTNFALFSEGAERVELCFYDKSSPHREIYRIPIEEHDDLVWHVYVRDVHPGHLYGYRVYGEYDAGRGLRFNPHKVLLDPYARAISGDLDWGDEVFGYRIGHPEEDLSSDERDSARRVPKCAVVDARYDWEGDELLRIPLHDTIVYETHVKGLTKRHPEVPEHLRGTYAGLVEPPVLDHFRKLGINAVELMPVHHFISDHFLLEKGLSNYWGYNSIGFFAPHSGYASTKLPGDQVREFKDMVKALHRHGIEVILDVVYNHTAEGNHLGPTLSFRGIDNQAYYRLVNDDPRFYMDYTGTGNTLNTVHPRVLQLIMDSLRYWVTEMHVDGFRFDLASALARGLCDVDRLGAFFDIIHQDPVLSQVKLIAEPWDLGEGGYQVGNFPIGWAEWNGKYRDAMRDYWRGEPETLAEFATRLTGSSDLYETGSRRPHASVNFVTAHDGFTLADLVSYNEKHNEANGEDNRDGADDNRSWNHGAEGPTDDPAIRALRERQKRNFIATLFLSQGIPMLLGGDEIGRTQRGNNNTWCQDNELSWYDWDHVDGALLEFTMQAIALRNQHPVLHRRNWFLGRSYRGERNPDVLWFKPDGEAMTESDWEQGFARSLAVFFNGKRLPPQEPNGDPISDSSFLILFNAWAEEQAFTLPALEGFEAWRAVLDTRAAHQPTGEREALRPGEVLAVEAQSLVVLQSPAPRGAGGQSQHSRP